MDTLNAPSVYGEQFKEKKQATKTAQVASDVVAIRSS